MNTNRYGNFGPRSPATSQNRFPQGIFLPVGQANIPPSPQFYHPYPLGTYSHNGTRSPYVYPSLPFFCNLAVPPPNMFLPSSPSDFSLPGFHDFSSAAYAQVIPSRGYESQHQYPESIPKNPGIVSGASPEEFEVTSTPSDQCSSDVADHMKGNKSLGAEHAQNSPTQIHARVVRPTTSVVTSSPYRPQKNIRHQQQNHHRQTQTAQNDTTRVQPLDEKGDLDQENEQGPRSYQQEEGSVRAWRRRNRQRQQQQQHQQPKQQQQQHHFQKQQQQSQFQRPEEQFSRQGRSHQHQQRQQGRKWSAEDQRQVYPKREYTRQERSYRQEHQHYQRPDRSKLHQAHYNGSYSETPQPHAEQTPQFKSRRVTREQQIPTRKESLTSQALTRSTRGRTQGSRVREQNDTNPVPELCRLNLDTSSVVLDDYNSDLHAQINHDGCSMTSRTSPPGFCRLWAGCKANFGVKKGKVFFEAKVERLKSYRHSSTSELGHFVARIGWSGEHASQKLGEEPLSFGYGSQGQFSKEDVHVDYGDEFTDGDVIGAMLNLDSNPATVSFMKNGEDLGIADTLFVDRDKPPVMFPHVYAKNYRIHVNFGQKHGWFPPPEGYQYIGLLPLSEMVPGLRPPREKSQCEVIMLVGLPGSGKSSWAIKKQQENPDKRYNILGTDILVESLGTSESHRMSYRERFNRFSKTADECFKTLIDIATGKHRNYILDQTNVYPKARQKKISAFSGFRRIAVIIQPSDQELVRRSRERTQNFGKNVPQEVVLNMKKNYTLPTKGAFHEVLYTELEESQARDLVKRYNRESF